jgi:hypothetical protein
MTEDNPGAAFETFSGGTTVNSEAVPDRPSASLADLEALLSEFDAATKPAEQPQATQPESAPKPETSDKIADDPVLSAIIKSREAMTEEARRHLSSYGARVDALFNDRIREFAQRDFDNIVAKGEKMLKESDIHVSEDYVRRWLTAESVSNPELRQAFDNRYRTKAHERAAERMVRKAMESLREAARHEPDEDATSSKLAVAAHLKSASTNKLPPEPPVRYGDITDAELDKQWNRLGKRA